ncbi:hypothetical protein [Stackebrandtia soli]|uniref:hypothetical protein n=1 Tax=Stackebrandtia soli TaxID=1892856 RepID=UPI0039EB0858
MPFVDGGLDGPHVGPELAVAGVGGEVGDGWELAGAHSRREGAYFAGEPFEFRAERVAKSAAVVVEIGEGMSGFHDLTFYGSEFEYRHIIDDSRICNDGKLTVELRDVDVM